MRKAARSGRSSAKAAAEPDAGTSRQREAESSSRTVALELLHRVLGRRRTLDESLAKHGGLQRLSTPDRAFARLLVATVLRRLGQLDGLIDHALERPLKPGLARLRDILRLGLAQLLFLDTPPHAAVNATVALARGPRLAGYRGLVNAVLRRLAREGEDLVAAQDAARLNTPDWLWEAWTEAHGAAATRAIAERHLAEPPLDLSLQPGRDRQLWSERLGAERLPGGSLRLAPGFGAIKDLPGYHDGDWWVQDLAAALPPRLFGAVAGRDLVDLCAAPGGKTAWLAAAGGRVTAIDRSESRMAGLRRNLERLRLTAHLVVADGAGWCPGRPADGIMLDAPCSSTGTLRRHPDIARLKQPTEIGALVEAQDRLLANAVEICASGGTIVYAVCSLQPEEGPARIAQLLSSRGDVERVPITASELDGLGEVIDREGDLRSLPCHLAEPGGMDGFYACRLRRL